MLTIEQILQLPEDQVHSCLVVTAEGTIAIQFTHLFSGELLAFLNIKAWMLNPQFENLPIETVYEMLNTVHVFNATNLYVLSMVSSVVIAITEYEDPHDYAV